jgi:hypothetical protein
MLRFAFPLFMLIVGFTSCSTKLEDSVPVTPENVLGTWKIAEFVPANDRTSAQTLPPCEKETEFQLKENGVALVLAPANCYQMPLPYGQTPIRWQLNHDSIYIEQFAVAGTAYNVPNAILHLTDSTMRIKLTGTGDVVLMKRL